MGEPRGHPRYLPLPGVRSRDRGPRPRSREGEPARRDEEGAPTPDEGSRARGQLGTRSRRAAGCPAQGCVSKTWPHCHGSFPFILRVLLQTGTGPIKGAVGSENCVASHNSGERESQERRQHFWQLDPLETICSPAHRWQLKPKAAGSTWSGPCSSCSPADVPSHSWHQNNHRQPR